MDQITIIEHDAREPFPAPLSAALDRGVKLVYADPPFNLGVSYDAYKDHLPPHAYIEFAERWVAATAATLRPDGWAVVCCPPEWAFTYESALRAQGLCFRERIIWHRTFGAQSQSGNRLSKAHTELLVFSAPGAGPAHWDRFRVQSARLAKYNDKRADPRGKVLGDVWELPDDPGGDVWRISMVCGTYRERVGWCPCQQPLRLVGRVLMALTEPEDLVFDPFSGAATTALACRILDRRCITSDIDAGYVSNGRARVALSEKDREQLRAAMDC